MSLVGGVGMLSSAIWQPIIGSWLDSEKETALASGVAENAAELIAGKAALGNMAYFPMALIFLFGLLFLMRKKLEKNRIPQS